MKSHSSFPPETNASRLSTHGASPVHVERARRAPCFPLIGLIPLLFAAGTVNAATSHWGWVTTSTNDPYVNRCAVNPIGSISNLPTNPSYVIAYRSGSDACSAPAPVTGNGLKHHQGIQRLTLGGWNYLLTTTSTNSGTQPGFNVVRLGSRHGNTGLLGGNTTPLQLPSCADAVVAYAGDNSGRDHAGGLQVSGNYAIVPLERIDDSLFAGFRIAHLGTPTAPVWGPLTLRARGQTRNAGAAGMTRLSDGRFIALTFGNDSDDVEVFVSTATSLPGHDGGVSSWISQAGTTTPFGGGNYQNLQIVTGCDGQMFVTGTHRDGVKDWADLWRLDLSPGFMPTFTKVANRHMYCSTANTGNTRYCDFAAGAGTYVDGAGALRLYGVEHYNDGYPNTTRAVKVREF